MKLKLHFSDMLDTDPDTSEFENVYIKEDLTKQLAQLAYKIRIMIKEDLINEVWIWDGVLKVKELNNKVHAIVDMDFE